jgi:DNA (cytosine-5)-methyltransferase 1
MNYYNENDKKAAEWLRQLINAGLIPDGYVDERSIADVKGSDLAGFTQCHFFAGIGGWAEALRLAGWSTDATVWTGSCPCQPLSVAGLGKGAEDERHLWPEFARLICECEPAVVFGEQVASPLGREWLYGVRSDLETLGYAVGFADLCAAGVGAPHIRQRLWWVADAMQQRESRRGIQGPYEGPGEVSRAACERPSRRGTDSAWHDFDLIPCLDGKARRIESGLSPLVDGFPGRVGLLRGYGNAIVPQIAAEFIRAFME